MDYKQHIENSLENIRVIFKEAAERIEALKPGEKVPATVLAQEIADKHDMTGPQLYPSLLFLIKGYPNVEVRRGAHGGIFKLGADIKPTNKKAVVAAVAAQAVSACVNSTVTSDCSANVSADLTAEDSK
jgi:hypothetical protein